MRPAEVLPAEAGPAIAPAVVAADAGTIMAVIARAASDPSTDVDKLDRLLGMYERITAHQAKTAYAAALAQMQPNLPKVGKRGVISVPGKDANKPGHETPFARWEDINEATRPILAEYGFALSFRMGVAQDGKITVTGILSHREGHQEETTITLAHDATGSKNAVQAVGSSVSYGKRYTAMALLNITTGDDDDGHAAGARYVTEEQAEEILALMESVGADRRKFLSFIGASSIGEIPAAKYRAALQALNAKRGR
jgi:hypothetical protein